MKKRSKPRPKVSSKPVDPNVRSAAQSLLDPMTFARQFFPQYQFYDKQVEILESIRDNDETVVVAGNMMGKDFVAGFAALHFFVTRVPCRVVTTSVRDDHLRVLWGEIMRFVQDSRVPLRVEEGGPLLVNHRDIRRIENGEQCPISYLRGMVSEKGEGMAGHHAKHTLFIVDEASGVDPVVYTQGCTWAKRVLIIGNPNPCPMDHFFYRSVKEGNVEKRPYSASAVPSDFPEQ